MRFRQPVLVETFFGRELTVGLIGTGAKARVLGTLEIVLLPGAEPDVYSYRNKEYCEELVEYRLVHAARDREVREAVAVALAAWRALGCRDAGRMDLRSDAAGQPHFLEANPLAGLHPTHSDLPILCDRLGMECVELIDRIVRSAMERVGREREFCLAPPRLCRSSPDYSRPWDLATVCFIEARSAGEGNSCSSPRLRFGLPWRREKSGLPPTSRRAGTRTLGEPSSAGQEN